MNMLERLWRDGERSGIQMPMGESGKRGAFSLFQKGRRPVRHNIPGYEKVFWSAPTSVHLSVKLHRPHPQKRCGVHQNHPAGF
jgi:hypothetical protein